jgi:hypothetical protein
MRVTRSLADLSDEEDVSLSEELEALVSGENEEVK